MKILIPILIVLLVEGCAVKKSANTNEGKSSPTIISKKTAVENDGYKGRVKSVKVTAFKIEGKNGRQIKTQTSMIVTKYDKKGNKFEMLNFDSSGKIERKTTYKYNEKGHRTEQLSFDTNGKTLRKITYKYDEIGNQTQQVYSYPSGIIFRKITHSNGGKIDQLFHDNGKIRSQTISKFDEQGGFWTNEEVRYDREGRAISQKGTRSAPGNPPRTIGRLDKRGLEIERLTYNYKREIIRKHLFKHDEIGNPVKSTIFTARTTDGETRFVPISETSREFIYWDE